MPTFNTRFNVLFALGAVTLIIGFMLQWYPEATIAGMEKRLQDPDLSTERRWELEGSLLSWEYWKVATFNPISITLVVTGLIIMLYAIIHGMFSLVSSYIDTKEK